MPSVYRCVGWRETLRRFHACAGRSGAGGVVASSGRAVCAATWPSQVSRLRVACSFSKRNQCFVSWCIGESMVSVDQQRGAAGMDAHSSRPSRRRDSRHEGTKQWETACLWVRLVWRHWRSSALHVLLRRLEGNAASFPRACGAQRLGGRRCCARYGRLRCHRGVNPLATKCERSDWVYPRITCGGTGGAMPSSVSVRRLEGNAQSFPRVCGAQRRGRA